MHGQRSRVHRSEIADGGLMHADAVGRTFDIGAEHADVIEFALEQTDQFVNLLFDFRNIG